MFVDWKMAKPRMHSFGKEDPPPDAPEYSGDVLCEHGAVSPNATHRKRISKEACSLTKDESLRYSKIGTDRLETY